MDYLKQDLICQSSLCSGQNTILKFECKDFKNDKRINVDIKDVVCRGESILAHLPIKYNDTHIKRIIKDLGCPKCGCTNKIHITFDESIENEVRAN